MSKRGYRIPKVNLACQYGRHFSDRVPVPFGSGDCDMPGFECIYEGDIEIPYTCEENNKCPAYKPEETKVCPKHNIEYLASECCDSCFPNAEQWL